MWEEPYIGMNYPDVPRLILPAYRYARLFRQELAVGNRGRAPITRLPEWRFPLMAVMTVLMAILVAVLVPRSSPLERSDSARF